MSSETTWNLAVRGGLTRQGAFDDTSSLDALYTGEINQNYFEMKAGELRSDIRSLSGVF